MSTFHISTTHKVNILHHRNTQFIRMTQMQLALFAEEVVGDMLLFDFISAMALIEDIKANFLTCFLILLYTTYSYYAPIIYKMSCMF